MTRFRYRILRYTPNLIRDEWVNIGVLLEDAEPSPAHIARHAMRVIEESSEIARIRRLHPDADETLLRMLPSEFGEILQAPPVNGIALMAKVDQTMSNVLQFGPVKGLIAEDFETELDRLYREHVAPPPRARGGIVESARGWIKARLDDVLRRRRVPRLERRISVEQFTEPGDSFRFDYGYRNGVRGFLHAVAIGRDPVQAKVLAYTADRVRAQLPNCEITAITESDPSTDNRRHAFVARLFEDSRITIVPLNRVEKFAEELRLRLQ
ncbi:MAG TPA: DUF3037 domain-containing protein [Candidatus Acidoferrales bacterium]|nr:DUF3037 domain-containing protein [Candidatus Acidoferrales bacterium]